MLILLRCGVKLASGQLFLVPSFPVILIFFVARFGSIMCVSRHGFPVRSQVDLQALFLVASKFEAEKRNHFYGYGKLANMAHDT